MTALLHADLVVDGMRLLDMLNCAHVGAHVRVGRLDRLLETLRRQTLLGKDLMLLLDQSL